MTLSLTNVSIRSIFARNLRSLCVERGLSINAACKGIGIARSQMDRYLAGENLPNERNLARMCAFFRVGDTVFFNAGVSSSPEGGPSGVVAQYLEQAEILLRSGPSSIASGNYQTLFTEPAYPDRIMVSLTLVRQREGMTVFRRVTRFPGGSSLSRRQFYHGDHRGTVIDRLGAHYFLGLDRVSAREPSVVAVRPMPISEGTLRGQALIMTDETPLVVNVVLRPLPPGMGLRTAIAQIGSVDISSPIVGPVARRLLRQAEP